MKSKNPSFHLMKIIDELITKLDKEYNSISLY